MGVNEKGSSRLNSSVQELGEYLHNVSDLKLLHSHASSNEGLLLGLDGTKQGVGVALSVLWREERMSKGATKPHEQGGHK